MLISGICLGFAIGIKFTKWWLLNIDGALEEELGIDDSRKIIRW